jgi:hypothetical protein
MAAPNLSVGDGSFSQSGRRAPMVGMGISIVLASFDTVGSGRGKSLDGQAFPIRQWARLAVPLPATEGTGTVSRFCVTPCNILLQRAAEEAAVFTIISGPHGASAASGDRKLAFVLSHH